MIEKEISENDELDADEFLASSNSASSSEDSTSDEDIYHYHEHVRIQDILAIINLYTDWDFKSHFRLHKKTAQDLIEMYDNSVHETDHLTKLCFCGTWQTL